MLRHMAEPGEKPARRSARKMRSARSSFFSTRIVTGPRSLLTQLAVAPTTRRKLPFSTVPKVFNGAVDWPVPTGASSGAGHGSNWSYPSRGASDADDSIHSSHSIRSAQSSRESRRNWASALIKMDPRRQICDFFRPGDHRGPRGVLVSQGIQPPSEPSSTFFSVWRPTSFDAIRMMMEGKAIGKSLNVKGKSAKKGRLSGYVPYVQISEESDKRKVGTSPAAAMVRLYFPTHAARSQARTVLKVVLGEMQATANHAERSLAKEKKSGKPLDDDTREGYLVDLRWSMKDPTITDLDEWGIGLMVPERLLWEAYVMRQDISHPPGWETGRASEPDYMDLNLHATREASSDQPRVVCYQIDEKLPMNPRGLVRG